MYLIFLVVTEKASPFILLTLKDPLEGMEGALLRSVLDIDCINNMTRTHAISDHSEDVFGNFVDLKAPLLTLDESIELIARTGLDSHLLCMLGIQSTDTEPGQDQDQDGPSNDEDELPTAHIWVDVDLQKELELGPEDTDTLIEPNKDTEAQTEPNEDQKDEELENSDVRGLNDFLWLL